MAKSVIKSHNPLLVEFVGLPGSGKTTVSYKVASILKAQGIEVVSRDEILSQWHQKTRLQKLFQLFPANLNHWHILLNSLSFAAGVKPINRQSFLQGGKIFVNVKRNDAVIHARNCQIILLEQGLLQEAWSVVITGSLPQLNYLKNKITPIFYKRSIVIVNFQLDLNTAVSRIQNRPRKKKKDSYFDLMNSNKAYFLLTQYFPYLKEIVSCARTAEVPVLEIDSSLPIEVNSEKIANWIVSQIH
ncbi:MAG: AAA family ATPase [Pleurocapsa sp.]